jgi:hypothetical protein
MSGRRVRIYVCIKWYQILILVYIFQAGGGRKEVKSTLIHMSSGIRARNLFVYFKQREKEKEDRVVGDFVRIFLQVGYSL